MHYRSTDMPVMFTISLVDGILVCQARGGLIDMKFILWESRWFLQTITRINKCADDRNDNANCTNEIRPFVFLLPVDSQLFSIILFEIITRFLLCFP